MLARDEADLLSLVLGADLTGLPPLLVSAVQHVQHIPELEAQRLTEEAAVRGLVIVKKSPDEGIRKSHELNTGQLLFFKFFFFINETK